VNTIDRREKLDFDYPSVLKDGFQPVDHVKGKLLGYWIGNSSLLTTDSIKGAYKIEVDLFGDESVMIYEWNMTKDKEKFGASSKADLFTIDNGYVIESDGGQIFRIHYLSDKQLKLDELLFERE
jgi:hypothetical protein